MKRDEAVALIRAFLEHVGMESSQGLNEQNLGGYGDTDKNLDFEYEPDSGSLKCSAVVYRFDQPPAPGILEAFRAEEQLGAVDTGGAAVDYEPESQGVFLMRRYDQPVPIEQFGPEMELLIAAARLWSEVMPERVAGRVFHSASA